MQYTSLFLFLSFYWDLRVTRISVISTTKDMSWLQCSWYDKSLYDLDKLTNQGAKSVDISNILASLVKEPTCIPRVISYDSITLEMIVTSDPNLKLSFLLFLVIRVMALWTFHFQLNLICLKFSHYSPFDFTDMPTGMILQSSSLSFHWA